MSGRTSALALAAGELLRLEAPEALEVRCESGRLWITETDRPDDVWLRAGESALLRGEGAVVLEAVEGARLSLASRLS